MNKTLTKIVLSELVGAGLALDALIMDVDKSKTQKEYLALQEIAKKLDALTAEFRKLAKKGKH